MRRGIWRGALKRSGWMRAPWALRRRRGFGEVWILMRGGARVAQIVRFRPDERWLAWAYDSSGAHARDERFWKRVDAKRFVEREVLHLAVHEASR